MAELRRELTHDVRDVGRSARAMTDVSFYVRKFPWATMAMAAGIGYLLVPKKKQVVYPDPETIADLVSKNQVRVEASTAPTGSKGLVESLVVMGLTWAARTGLNYIGQQLTAAAANKAKASSSKESESTAAEPEPASPPMEEPR
jgi:hypothetical protein